MSIIRLGSPWPRIQVYMPLKNNLYTIIINDQKGLIYILKSVSNW